MDQEQQQRYERARVKEIAEASKNPGPALPLLLLLSASPLARRYHREGRRRFCSPVPQQPKNDTSSTSP
jgi:hypothetical protein